MGIRIPWIDLACPDIDPDEKKLIDCADIRHACLRLILPILSTQAFHAQAKPLLPHLYSNLPSDPPITVYRVLNAVWSAITAPSAGLGRRVALVMLDENALENLLKLLSRDEMESTSGRSVAEMTMAFLSGVTTNPGTGICFPDEGWYPRRTADNQLGLGADDEVERRGSGVVRENKFRSGLHNRILSNAMRRVGAKVVDDQGRIGDWALKVFRACPEIIAGLVG